MMVAAANIIASLALLACVWLGASGNQWAENIATFFIATSALIGVIVATGHMKSPRAVGTQRPILATISLATVVSAAAVGWFWLAAAELVSLAFYLATTVVGVADDRPPPKDVLP